MFEKMESGLFPDAVTRDIREVECTWWTGPEMNVNAKYPGTSWPYRKSTGFDGAIKSVMYDVDMIEIRSVMTIRNTKTHVTARRYTNDLGDSSAAEFGNEGRATNSMVKAILGVCVGIVVDLMLAGCYFAGGSKRP
ncbi:hypothetical protein AYL99_12038 [Fonsecaea erecta]|uniref:Uncharacterized protein n=1 Tax=Fonsecaea erecta TaxID=1367422 RepID=A0A178Z237_9EURO|nr:hypothetical protein AYL99_12038 [Fonsecaea erecta]OAP53754.1 hypothetical protein AYL99_12038 [Fonsecaea erecta]